MTDLKSRLATGDTLVGSFLKTPSPILVEVLGTTGLDCLCIDAEHAPFDRAAIDSCLFAGRAAGLGMLVRVPSAAPEHILNALDGGADGVLVPHVLSAAKAAATVRAATYGPGGRGYAGSTRAAGYGLSTMAEHRQRSAAQTLVIAQIEDVEAVEAIDEIARVPGIDALFIGRIDLTVALGAASPDDPRVIAAVERVIAAGREAGVPIGMFVPRDTDVPGWRAMGARLFLQGSEHAFIRSGTSAMLTACRT